MRNLKRAEYTEAVQDGTVVFWTDIFLLGILGLFAIATIPRVASRFSQRTERWKGIILCESVVASTNAQNLIFIVAT